MERLANANDFDSWIMFNVYPQRATDPNDMDRMPDRALCDETCAGSGQFWPRPNPPCGQRGTLIEKRDYLPSLMREMVALTRERDIPWVTFGKRSKRATPTTPSTCARIPPRNPLMWKNYLDTCFFNFSGARCGGIFLTSEHYHALHSWMDAPPHKKRCVVALDRWLPLIPFVCYPVLLCLLNVRLLFRLLGGQRQAALDLTAVIARTVFVPGASSGRHHPAGQAEPAASPMNSPALNRCGTRETRGTLLPIPPRAERLPCWPWYGCISTRRRAGRWWASRCSSVLAVC